MANTTSMPGVRLPDSDDEFPAFEPGTYCRYKGTWWVMLPNGDLVDVRTWTIVENADGTITITPSMQTMPPEAPDSWHGFLTNGQFVSV